ncbi:MarR family winged helix-turn-helix transcriptional regulator [Virgibacillus sp. W0181]|uniref:MarR family winged helix-turn-helix transcriptional regulator n=1 Tax=Virgibacillus sp. W0181 TaxID=3391581 RepID=UPI003F457499
MVENDIRELMQTIATQTRKEYASKFREMNLHVGQETALCYLWEKDGITQSELRHKMQCEASTVSNMLRKLEQDSIVYRKPDKTDGRISNVFLTEKGRKLQEPIRDIWEKQQHKMLKDIPPEELLLMRRILKQMAENLTDEG